MIDDTDKPTEKASEEPQAVTGAKAPTVKPAVKPRALRAAPALSSPSARKPPASATKAKTATAPKSVKRSAVAKKSTAGKKAVGKAAPAKDKKTDVAKPGKVKKPKLVRDSFTMPKGEYAVIPMLKERCLKAGVPAKKSEILRAAIANLAKLSDASLAAAIQHLDVVKTGRPAKGSK
ncbi:MAG: hypothetical protein WBX11_18885 [Thiobacillaceae bacterium]